MCRCRQRWHTRLHRSRSTAAPPLHPRPGTAHGHGPERLCPSCLCGSPSAHYHPAVIYSSAFPVFCLSRSPCRAVPAGRDARGLGLGAAPGKMSLPTGQQVQKNAVPGARMCLLPPHRSRCFPYEFSTCFLPSFAFCNSSSGSLALLAPTVCVRNKH